MSNAMRHDPSNGLTRRAFLAKTSLAAAGLAVGTRHLSAMTLDARRVLAGITPAMCLSEPRDPAVLRHLATQAMDAATKAGATYADIRVAERQYFVMNDQFGTELEEGFSYGVRVLIDGGWAFVHGTVPTADAVVAAARGAVAQARQNAAIVHATLSKSGHSSIQPDVPPFVPAPAVTGEWSIPITVDPFAVPIQDQMALLVGWNGTGHRHWPAYAFSVLVWRRETRVFASSTGSLVTQHFTRSRSEQYVRPGRKSGWSEPWVMTQSSVPRSGGYELVADPAIYDQITMAADETLGYAALPMGILDVGRYPVVFDGAMMGAALYTNLGLALEMDRVLGEEADSAGTSLLAPPMDVLGTAIASPVLTVTADRALPSYACVKWDDDGVVPRSGPVISAGTLVDYQTSLTTAPALAPWYQRHGQAMTSFGSAVATEADHPVQVRCGHLTVAPAQTATSIDDLIRDMSHGLLIRSGGRPATDQQLSSSSLYDNAMYFEVSRGRVVKRLMGNGVQWSTRPFWKGLTAVGDATTMRGWGDDVAKGQPWHQTLYTTSAPAGHFKAIDVVSLQ